MDIKPELVMQILSKLSKWALRLLASLLARLFYRVRITGLQHLPRTGGVLLVCNHVSYVDALLVGVHLSRSVRFLAFDELFQVPLLGALLRANGCIPISSRRPKEATIRTIELLRSGEVVCIFPEGELTRTGEVMGFRRGMELIARKAAVPIVPIYLDSFWGSIFSFAGGRYFWKWPGQLPRKLGLAIGAPLASNAHAEVVRQAILSLGADTFAQRSELTMGLGWTALQRLAANPRKLLMVDCTKKPAPLSCGRALAVALVLAGEWRRTLPGHRIGIILPPGRAAVIANLALTFAGKVPVNLNPTVSQESAATTLRTAEITEVITAGPVHARLPKYPWPPFTKKIEEEISAVSKTRLFFARVLVWILPWRILAMAFGVARTAGEEEAVLLFTSGSSGDPKGVVLTHANILANVTQISLIGLLGPKDRILGCLPLFHSFGSTFTLWMPLLRDIGLVTAPSPLDAAAVGAAVAGGKATILVGTPTFLRAFARKIPAVQFESITLAVAGAEKVPEDLAQTYQDKYKIQVFEGYGLTETSPVLAVNLPDPVQGFAANSQQIAHRPGSVGRLLPGLSYRLVDSETGAPVEAGQTGLLQIRGASVFGGYLKDARRTDEVMKDCWFITGDLARVDEDGFLFIEGRLSRFAKIGGEMVPLAKIEECIASEFPAGAAQGPAIALVSIPHETKGEELALLTIQALERESVRLRLSQAGLPNLWIPRMLCQVPEIPMLASGKIDWRTCQQIAAECAAKQSRVVT